MNVLLTNDDGYLAPGMLALLDTTRAMGWLPFIVAPTHGMSGASRARRSGLHIPWNEDAVADCVAYHLDATPASCVVFALTSGLLPEIDLVLSGVNAGENLGAGLTISGTFGAALEAAAYGVRAIAVSRQYEGDIGSDPTGWDWSRIPQQLGPTLEWCMDRSDWDVCNINLPNRPDSDHPTLTTISRQSYFGDRYDPTTCTIVSDYGYRASLLDNTEDIFQFAIRRRVSVTCLFGLLNSVGFRRAV
jgi:5'/3'-nucleotidase